MWKHWEHERRLAQNHRNETNVTAADAAVFRRHLCETRSITSEDEPGADALSEVRPPNLRKTNERAQLFPRSIPLNLLNDTLVHHLAVVPLSVVKDPAARSCHLAHWPTWTSPEGNVILPSPFPVPSLYWPTQTSPGHVILPSPFLKLSLYWPTWIRQRPRVLTLSVPRAVCPLAHVEFAGGKRVRTVPVGHTILSLAHVDARCEVPRHSLVRLFASFVRANRLGQWSRQPLDLA